jgi:hypothetical protein
MLPLSACGALVKVTERLNVVIFAAAFRTSVNQASLSLQGAPDESLIFNVRIEKRRDFLAWVSSVSTTVLRQFIKSIVTLVIKQK